MTTPTAGGLTAEIVPFPVDAIRPSAPRVGGTLRGMICGRPVAGPITAKHHSFMAAGLVEGLEPTGRSFYFREAGWDATEFWLPVVELAQPVRVLDWPHWPTPEHPVAFGAGTLPAELVAPDEAPRIGGTLRAMIGSKVYAGPVDKEPVTCVRGDLVEHLKPTGRNLWFEEGKQRADEFLLPVIGLRSPVRAVAWEIPEPVRFGSGVLRHRPALARGLPSATILPFVGRPTLRSVVEAGEPLMIGDEEVRYVVRPDQRHSKIHRRFVSLGEAPRRLYRCKATGEPVLGLGITVWAPAPVPIWGLFLDLGEVDVELGSDALATRLPDERRMDALASLGGML